MKLAAALLSTVFSLGWCGAAAAANPCVTAAGEAQDLRVSSRLREARAALLACSAPACNAVVRASCEKWLVELDEQQPTVVVRTVDARGRDVLGANVTVDDAKISLDGSVVAVDPGWHLARATTSAGDVANQRFLVALGEKARILELRFDPPSVSKPAEPKADARPKEEAPPAAEKPTTKNLTMPLVLGAVGLVALGAFGYFELVGHSNYADLENGCFRTKTCTPALEDPVKAQFVAAYVSLGVAAVALGAAAILYFTSGTPPGKTVSTRGLQF